MPFFFMPPCETLLSNESWNFIIETTQRTENLTRFLDHRGSGSVDFQKGECHHSEASSFSLCCISDFTSKVHRTKASRKSTRHRSFQYLESLEGLMMLSCLEGRHAALTQENEMHLSNHTFHAWEGIIAHLFSHCLPALPFSK